MDKSESKFQAYASELDHMRTERTGDWAEGDRVFDWWHRLEDMEGIEFADKFDIYYHSQQGEQNA